MERLRGWRWHDQQNQRWGSNPSSPAPGAADDEGSQEAWWRWGRSFQREDKGQRNAQSAEWKFPNSQDAKWLSVLEQRSWSGDCRQGWEVSGVTHAGPSVDPESMSFILSSSGESLRVPQPGNIMRPVLIPLAMGNRWDGLHAQTQRIKRQVQKPARRARQQLRWEILSPTSLQCLHGLSRLSQFSTNIIASRDLSYSPGYCSFRFIPTEQYDLNVEPSGGAKRPQIFLEKHNSINSLKWLSRDTVKNPPGMGSNPSLVQISY